MAGTSEGARKSATPEARAKRAEAMRRKWADPEFKARRAATEAKPEVKARRSAAAKEVNARPEKAEQQSAMMKRLHADPEFKARHADGMRRANAEDPEINARRAETMRLAWEQAPELFDNSLKAIRDNAVTPEGRKIRSETLRRLWRDDDRLRQNLIDMRSGRFTGIELAVADYVCERGLPYLMHYPAGRWELDVFVPSLMLDIEADGLYWHSDENWPGRSDHDARRDAGLTKLGYRVLRLSEAEIKARDWSRLDQVLTDAAGG